MLFYFIKYFTLIFCGNTIYDKSLNISHDISHIAIYAGSSMIMSALLTMLKMFADINEYMLIGIMLCGFVFLQKKLSKRDKSVCIITSLFSIAICYIINICSWFICSFIKAIFITHDIRLPDLLIYCTLFCITYLLVMVLFKIKRFSKGFAFLHSVRASYIDVVICMLILVFYSIACTNNDNNYVIFESIIIIIFLAVLLFIWWKKNITSIYQERQHTKELEYAQALIKSKEEKIEKLKTNNDALAAIIHKDNKLIPALQKAVKESVNERSSLADNLQQLRSERNMAIDEYTSITEHFKKTGIFLIDSMLEYMYQKAEAEGCEFSICIKEPFDEIIEKYISEKDLCTLLADLCENAIIAVRKQDRKNVKVTTEKSENNIFEIIFSDSGAQFDENVLLKLGNEKITSHINDGGSGIGMMTTFKILKKSNASIEITEFMKDEIFSKNISIIFDSKGEYRINSIRKVMLEQDTKRRDIVFM